MWHFPIENLSVHQIITLLNNSWQANYGVQMIGMWSFPSPSTEKPQPQKVPHLKQNTFRALLPPLTVLETHPACRICNYPFDGTLAPQTDPKKQSHSMWVYRDESMGHERKGMRPPHEPDWQNSWMPCTVQGYDTNQRLTGIYCTFSSKSWVCALM